MAAAISEDVGHLVVAIEDRFDDAQFGAVLVQPRLVAAEDQRYPFVGVNKAGGGDERSDQPVDRAHADRAGVAGAAQNFVELDVGERVRHAASPPLLWSPAHAHGISSSIRADGHR